MTHLIKYNKSAVKPMVCHQSKELIIKYPRLFVLSTITVFPGRYFFFMKYLQYVVFYTIRKILLKKKQKICIYMKNNAL